MQLHVDVFESTSTHPDLVALKLNDLVVKIERPVWREIKAAVADGFSTHGDLCLGDYPIESELCCKHHHCSIPCPS